MFDRFTDRARRVMVLAQEEARALGNDFLRSEHILLGLVHERDGVAARVLSALDVVLDDVRAETLRRLGPCSPSIESDALATIGIDFDAVKESIEDTFGEGALERTWASRAQRETSDNPFTLRAKKVLELSLREALQFGHNYIGTEHLLLGLVREGEGIAAQVLLARGLTLDTARAAVITQLKQAG